MSDFRTSISSEFRQHRWETLLAAKAEDVKSALIELKITKTKTLPFSKIAPHQYTSLLKAKTGTLVHKLSDSSIGFLPADMFVLARSSAYLCVMFYVPRKPKIIYLLDINKEGGNKLPPNSKFSD